jgi:hypothetical protein
LWVPLIACLATNKVISFWGFLLFFKILKVNLNLLIYLLPFLICTHFYFLDYYVMKPDELLLTYKIIALMWKCQWWSPIWILLIFFCCYFYILHHNVPNSLLVYFENIWWYTSVLMNKFCCVIATFEPFKIVLEPWLSVWRNTKDISQPDQYNHVFVPANFHEV